MLSSAQYKDVWSYCIKVLTLQKNASGYWAVHFHYLTDLSNILTCVWSAYQLSFKHDPRVWNETWCGLEPVHVRRFLSHQFLHVRLVKELFQIISKSRFSCLRNTLTILMKWETQMMAPTPRRIIAMRHAENSNPIPTGSESAAWFFPHAICLCHACGLA